MLPSTLKYSRCPSKDAKTLRKPPIIFFYGGLGSRLGIITVIFTRLGTKTTDRAEVPGLPSLRLYLPSHGKPQHIKRETRDYQKQPLW